ERLDPERDMDMIYLDVNHFHLINELYGRQFGKNVLKAIGEVIKEISEENDGIGCRSYADCFYIYCRHREEHTDILDRFRSRLAQMPNDVKIEIRMGVYSQVDKDSDMEICADRAKAACDTLRNDYTRFIAYYDEKLINNVHDAIKQRQFVVYYQPKYCIQGDEPKLKSAEALIRWIHPEYGMISPGDFIPLFEDNGLIQLLDSYVWSEVAKQIKTWKDKFGVSVPVSVNISRMDMYDPELENKLISNIENNGLDTSEYMLEITESAYADNAAQLTDIINRLRDKGFMIEMDDFGAGYSSLNMITEIPIDVLKIDMKFIRNMNKDEKNKKIVQLILDIAKFINAKTVAEGVEDEKQYKELKELGCDVIQGYYFSKPVPPDEFEKFIVG
ncbi:MAG: EAL domain-containing protein, partial [Firmicutes bacterium]|nr:EAL domain-containing protein [Bacillota bacterium]